MGGEWVNEVIGEWRAGNVEIVVWFVSRETGDPSPLRTYTLSL